METRSCHIQVQLACTGAIAFIRRENLLQGRLQLGASFIVAILLAFGSAHVQHHWQDPVWMKACSCHIQVQLPCTMPLLLL